MAFIKISRDVLSDLVYHELEPAVGYSRKTVVVQADGELKIGTVAFRAKTTNLNAPYAPVTGAGDLSLDNEYVVLFGDHYGCKEKWTVTPDADKLNSVGFNGDAGGVFLKDLFIIETTGFERDSDEYNQLKQVLANQNMILEKTL